MKTLQQLEREYFVKKVGGANNSEPLNNIKRRYFVSFLTGYPVGPGVHLDELESSWLVKTITDKGGTVNDDDDYAALWKIAVAQFGQTPSGYLADNQRMFYVNSLLSSASPSASPSASISPSSSPSVSPSISPSPSA